MNMLQKFLRQGGVFSIRNQPKFSLIMSYTHDLYLQKQIRLQPTPLPISVLLLGILPRTRNVHTVRRPTGVLNVAL